MQAPSGPQGHGRALLAPPPSPWTPPGSPSAGFRISKAEFYSSAPRKHALRDTALPYRGSPGESGEGARISLPHQLPAQPPGIAQPPPRPPSRLLRPPLLPSHLLLLLFLPRGLCPASVPGSREVAAVRGASAVPETQKPRMFFLKTQKRGRGRAWGLPHASCLGSTRSRQQGGGEGGTAASPSLPSDVFAKNPGYKEI